MDGPLGATTVRLEGRGTLRRTLVARPILDGTDKRYRPLLESCVTTALADPVEP
jgi:hypothetical protein